MTITRIAWVAWLVLLLRRSRARLYWICAALTAALVTGGVYDDIVEYYSLENPPHLLGWVLAVKTAVVYAALAYIFRQLRFVALSGGKTDAAQGDHSATASGKGGPLDELLNKPKLRSRAEYILKSRKGDAE